MKTTTISTATITDERTPDAWLGGRSFDDWRVQFDRDGYLVFENVLSETELSDIKGALAPWLGKDIKGRNEFEGRESHRVYAMLAKSPVFADLVTHPLALAFAEADLGRDCLLSACLAINLHPGETAQPWHFDDSHYQWPRPRPSLGVSTFWTITDTTDANGATEILPRSHLWTDDFIDGAIAEVLRMDRENGLLSRDIASVDLRLEDRLVIGLTPKALVRRTAALAEQAKAAKKNRGNNI